MNWLSLVSIAGIDNVLGTAEMTTPFICVLVAFLMIYAMKAPVALAMAKMPGGYDNKHPRDQQAALTGWGKRALSAHLNAFEGFPPFAASVFVAHLGGGNADRAAMLAITYVVSRVVYNVLYLANIDKLRSLVWGVGFAATIGLFASPWMA